MYFVCNVVASITYSGTTIRVAYKHKKDNGNILLLLMYMITGCIKDISSKLATGKLGHLTVTHEQEWH